MKQMKIIGSEEIGFHEGLEKELSTYFEKTIHEDGSVLVEQVSNPYFLVNDKWNINDIGEIKQFKEVEENCKYSNQNVHFRFNNPLVNLEVKYVYYQNLFNDFWSIKYAFVNQSPLRRVTEFINEKYPKLSSVLDLDIEKAEREYIFWLNEKGIKTHEIIIRAIQKDSILKTPVARFLSTIYTSLSQYTDKREEWEKNRWDVRHLHDRYGINYNKSKYQYYIDFSKIPTTIREQVKKYFKQRLLSKNKFAWGTALNYMTYLPSFFTFVFTLEPKWKDLKALKRKHIEKYIEYLHEYTQIQLKQKNAHPEAYISQRLVLMHRIF